MRYHATQKITLLGAICCLAGMATAQAYGHYQTDSPSLVESAKEAGHKAGEDTYQASLDLATAMATATVSRWYATSEAESVANGPARKLAEGRYLYRLKEGILIDQFASSSTAVEQSVMIDIVTWQLLANGY